MSPSANRPSSRSLAQDNLRAGLFASSVGLVVVAIFLIGYYYLAGIVATVRRADERGADPGLDGRL